jgi:PAS domain S-box-containing protein
MDKDDLRQKAYEIIKGKKHLSQSDKKEMEELIEELRIHEVELFIQNEELSRSEKSLTDAKERYRKLFEFSPVGYFVIDKMGLIREVNMAASRMIGLGKNKIAGKNFSSFMMEKESDVFYFFKRNIIEKKGSHETEITIFNKNKKPVPIYLKGVKISENMIQLASIDMSNIKKAQSRIFSLVKFLEESPDPLLRLDKKLKLIYLNKAAESLLSNLGIKNGSVLPEQLVNQILPLKKDRDTDKNFFEVKIGRSIYEFTVVEVKVNNYYNLYGKDVTDRKRVEKLRLKSFKTKILDLERKKIARELHDSVTQNLFSSTILSENIPKSLGEDPQRTLKNVETIRELNRSALHEIRSLLYDLVPESIGKEDLANLIKGLVDLLKRRDDIKDEIKVEFEINGSYDPPANIKHEVYRIAQEAINNALRHSNATLLKITLDLARNNLGLIISDNGSGFNITKDSFKRKYGLSTMKERARLIGASIEFKSEAGKGTTIALRLRK